MKAKGNEGIQNFGLCCGFCQKVSWPIQQQAHNFPDMSSAAELSPGVLLAAFHHLHDIQLYLDLSFLTVSLNSQTVPLCIFWVTCPSFCLFPIFPSCLRFSGSSLFIHAGLLPVLLDFLLMERDPSWEGTHFSGNFTVQHTCIHSTFVAQALNILSLLLLWP